MMKQQYIFTAIGILLAALALLTPFRELVEPAHYVGGLLIWAGVLELVHGFRRSEKRARLSARINGGITLLIGILLVNAELFQEIPLVQIIAFLLFIDALRYLFLFFRNKAKEKSVLDYLLPGIGNLLIILLILLFKGKGFTWMVAIAGTLRILGTVYNLITAKLGSVDDVSEDVVENLGIEDDPRLLAMAVELEKEEANSAALDAGWIVVFLLTLFFIHLGRMGFDRSTFGILSPLVAVIGDMFIALVIAYGILGPIRIIFSKLNSYVIKILSRWAGQVPRPERRPFSPRNLADWWVKEQLRLSISMRKSSYSFATALRNGLKIGLPFAAILAAIMPVLGMSWYFDTENWASGIWDGYAGSRTEAWREAMVAASGEKPGPNAFNLQPEGLPAQGDFSFVIIGDPGEGDPSQLILKDQILAVSNKPDVRFVVISSDLG